MKTIYSTILLLVISVSAKSAEFSGKIQSLAVGPNLGGWVLVRVEGQSPTAAWSTTCSTNTFWSFKFDTNVAGGKETYSLLLAAYTSKSSVVINGTGTCANSSPEAIQNLNYARFEF